MNKRMLIDTSHAEETRVVVLDGNRLEDYDVETAAKKQLKGNIYLAKVVRVEPSLQAAFVEYGGGRHGFLAFAEIHPDYYQIPVADRQKLIAAQEEEARAEEARAEAEQDRAEALAAQRGGQRHARHDGEAGSHENGGQDGADSHHADDDAHAEAGIEGEAEAQGDNADGEAVEGEILAPETLGGEDDTPRESAPRRPRMRHYTIQEVIRRRQILLIQVVKEERGNKGAALTTYISLAGRFCVLMPNSLRDGGVSRKITSAADRRRLKEITSELEIPRGMGMIVRTAGAQRPRAEIKRDCEYLLELWDDIRERTLASVAPALIHEEASLIRRAIRDGYSRDIEEVLVDGEGGWKSAREFMRVLMPDHARKVQLWNGSQPLFSHYQVEGHLDSMLNPTVQLRSGGYLVINQTEALVSIDVNSGRATRERGIEETAFRTNVEAADEVARQLRLRDLAGLIVIDFIDMESRKHIGAVERRLKDALRQDRARIQVGSISAFGLMEMSRQRLRPSIAESSLTPCPHCAGSGLVRGTDSSALHVLRVVEEEAARRRAAEILVLVASPVALYILNHKRVWLSEIEARYGLVVGFAADDTLLASQVKIDRVRIAEPVETVEPERTRPSRPVEAAPAPAPRQHAPAPVAAPVAESDADDDAESGDETEASGENGEQNGAEGGTDEQRRRRRRRRRRGGRRDDSQPMPLDAEQPETAGYDPYGQRDAAAAQAPAAPEAAEAAEAENAEAVAEASAPEGERGEEGRERGERQGRRRGGRRRGRDRDRGNTGQTEAHAPVDAPVQTGPTPADPFGGLSAFEALEGDLDHRPAPLPTSVIGALSQAAPEPEPTPAAEAVDVTPAEPETVAEAAPAAEAPAPKARRSRKKAAETETAPEAASVDAPAKPARATRSRKKAVVEAEAAPEGVATPEAAPVAAEEPAAKPARATRGRKKAAPVAEPEAPAVAEATEAAAEPIAADNAPKPVLIEAGAAPAKPRAGWWRR